MCSCVTIPSLPSEKQQSVLQEGRRMRLWLSLSGCHGGSFKLWKYESLLSVVQSLSIRNKDTEFVAVIVVIVVDDKHLCCGSNDCHLLQKFIFLYHSLYLAASDHLMSFWEAHTPRRSEKVSLMMFHTIPQLPSELLFYYHGWGNKRPCASVMTIMQFS